MRTGEGDLPRFFFNVSVALTANADAVLGGYGSVKKGQTLCASDEQAAQWIAAGVARRPEPEPIRQKVAQAVVVVASGPSAQEQRLRQWRNADVIAVNDSYRLAPWARALYACDPQWWEFHISDVRGRFGGECWTQDKQTAEKYGLRWIAGYDHPGLSRDPSYIHFNSNSGAQAINLAVLWGAKRLILVGFDMKVIGGRRHWFGDHPGVLNKASTYRDWLPKYRQIAKDLKDMGVACVNCSPDSALDCFDKRPLEDALAEAGCL